MAFDGLFSKKSTELQGSPDGKFYGCFSCGLSKAAKHPRMQPWGLFKKKILIIKPTPTFKEDRAGRPWVGNVSTFFKNMLKDEGIDLYEDCLTTFAVQCPAFNEDLQERSPTGIEIRSCSKIVHGIISKYKPKLIILLGKAPLLSIFQHRWKKGSFEMNKWMGWLIPDQDLKTWVLPMMHPSTLFKMQEFPEVKRIWLNHFEDALQKYEAPIPEYSLNPDNIQIIDTESEIRRFLHLLRKQKLFVWDIETTGIKPHDKSKHKIFVISFCWEDNKAYTITMPKEPRNIQLLRKILADKNIAKIAHNMKYENMWANVILDTKVENWYWDTMQAAHVLNNQPGIVGLKFQTLVRLGTADYDSEVSSFLKAEDNTDGNSVNRLAKLMETPQGREKVMLYCGYDSLCTYRLFKLQKEEL